MCMIFRSNCCKIGFIVLFALFALESCFFIAKDDTNNLTNGGKITTFELIPGNGMFSASWTSTVSDDANYCIVLTVYPTSEDSSKYKRIAYNYSGAALFTSYTRSTSVTEDLKNDISYSVDAALYSYTQSGETISISDPYDTISKTVVPSASIVTQTAAITSSGPYVIELEGDKNFITVSGVNGKRIMYANVNTTDNAINGSDIRVLAGAVSNSGTVLTNIIKAPSVLDTKKNNLSLRAASPASFDGRGIRYFVPPKNPGIVADTHRAPVAADTYDPDNPAVEQKKQLYVDVDSSMSKFAKKSFTLQAIGRDSLNKIICIVWVDDTRFTSGTAQYNSITKKLAEDIAKAFTTHYQQERDIFGKEADTILTVSTGSVKQTSMPEQVNIVVYDIGNDYGKSEQTGIVGYFYSKDYYTNGSIMGYGSNGSVQTLDFSNEGKYFYVDVAYCNYTGKDYKGNGDRASTTVISTLFHEFQHMINFNQKIVKHPDRTDAKGTWYDEMLSMLAEDILQKELGITDGDSPKGRLPTFNYLYALSGITDYLDGEYAVISYSTAYAFGAWLMRNYGGLKLVKEISTNAEVNMKSVVNAVNTVNSLSLAKDDIIKNYVQACAFRTAFAKDKNLPTFNKAVSDVMNGTAYNINGINLFSDDYKWRTPDADSYYYGPALLLSDYPISVRPNGFILHGVNTENITSSNTVTLAFSPRKSNTEKVYIYVQDWASTSTKDTTEVAE